MQTAYTIILFIVAITILIVSQREIKIGIEKHRIKKWRERCAQASAEYHSQLETSS